jgi:hypothetical protein
LRVRNYATHTYKEGDKLSVKIGKWLEY